MRSTNKEVADIIAVVRKAGWRVEHTDRNHWKFYSPDGEGIVTCPGTPQGTRWSANLKSQLRRHGVEVPHRNGRKPKR